MTGLGDPLASYIVKPQAPTLPGTNEYWDLSPSDLLHGFSVDTAYVIPAPIDIDRFKDALSKTLSVFPLPSGRLSYPSIPEDPWRILLSGPNTGVPVKVYESRSDRVFPTNTIVQGTSLSIVERVDAKTLFTPRSEEASLTKVSLVWFPMLGCTSIGISSAHVIGDGFNAYQFARFLSQYYQGLPPFDNLPCYSPSPVYPLSDKFNTLPIPSMNHTFHRDSVPPFLDPTREKPLRFYLRLSTKQVGELQKGVTDQRSTEEAVTLSRQDAFVALIAKCYSKTDQTSPPVQHISTLFMPRGTGPCPATIPTNAISFTVTDPIHDPVSASLYHIASRIRRSVEVARIPEFISSVLRNMETRFVQCSNAGLMVDLTPAPGHMLVNSTWKFNWHSAHFGYPNQTQFYHTLLDEPRFLKIFQPNPYRLHDGTWQSFTSNDAEITCHVRSANKEPFEEVLRDELRVLGVSGNVEIIWT